MAASPDHDRPSRRARLAAKIRIVVLLALLAILVAVGFHARPEPPSVRDSARAAPAIVVPLPAVATNADDQTVAFAPESILLIDGGSVHIDAAPSPEPKIEPARPVPEPVAAAPLPAPKETPLPHASKPMPPREADVPRAPAKVARAEGPAETLRQASAAPHPVPAKPAKPVSRPTVPGAPDPEGRLPALRAGFDAIGWAEWVKQMTRLDARFYVVADDGALGPEIDIKAARLIKRRDPSDVDLNRPFLIRNNEAGELLRHIELKPGYRRDVLVMLFANWSSRFLWSRLDRVLKDRQLKAGDVSEISADYMFDGGHLYLAVHAAVLRATGEPIPLKEMVEIPS